MNKLDFELGDLVGRLGRQGSNHSSQSLSDCLVGSKRSRMLAHVVMVNSNGARYILIQAEAELVEVGMTLDV